MTTSVESRHRHLWAELVAQIVVDQDVDVDDTETVYDPGDQPTKPGPVGKAGFAWGKVAW